RRHTLVDGRVARVPDGAVAVGTAGAPFGGVRTEIPGGDVFLADEQGVAGTVRDVRNADSTVDLAHEGPRPVRGGIAAAGAAVVHGDDAAAGRGAVPHADGVIAARPRVVVRFSGWRWRRVRPDEARARAGRTEVRLDDRVRGEGGQLLPVRQGRVPLVV